MQPAVHPQPAPQGILTRHPLDPDPVRDSKATAVLSLGIVATLTGFLLGGVIPAALAFHLAGQARREMTDSRGYLTGTRRIRIGLALAWAGLGLAAAGLVAAVIYGLVNLVDSAGAIDFPASVD